MNPLTNIRSLNNLIDQEIKLGRVGTKASWHEQYRASAWCFYGGMPFELCEGDIICMFSQYGEIVNLNLVRDKKTGKSRGYGFVCYENQKSTDLAVDNFNGAKILDRVIKVDHVLNYIPPKENEELDDMTKFLHEEGCAPTTLEEKKDKISDLEKEALAYKLKIKEERNKEEGTSYSDRSRNDQKDRNRNDKYKDDKDHDRQRQKYDDEIPPKKYREYEKRSDDKSYNKSNDKSSRRRSPSPRSRSPQNRRRDNEYQRDDFYRRDKKESNHRHHESSRRH
jgi:RNA-binding motif X-linked protein 2